MGMTRTSPRFRRLLVNAIIVPLMLMIVVAAVLVGQIKHLLHDSHDVEHSDHLIARISELQTLTVDLETGLRGFLVAGDDRFLDPYNKALAIIDLRAADLLKSVDDSLEIVDLRDLNSRRQKWLEYARQQIETRRRNGDYVSVALGLTGKNQMDEMRAILGRLIDHESQVRAHRFADAQQASDITLAIVAGVAIGGGVMMAALSRSQFIEITKTYDAALAATTEAKELLEQRVADRTQELQKRSTELADANKELEAFSYSISHDLRAPMRHIAGFCGLLEKSIGKNLAAEDAENLTTIHETAKVAGRMVDDLLAFSRVGRTKLRLAPVDLNRLILECQKELHPDTQHRQIEWKIAPLPSVQGDAAMLKMVLQNLLANAVKYTNKRDVAVIEIGTSDVKPPVDPASAPMPRGTDRVTCFVRDNGVGFNMDYAGKLFGVFQRLHRSEEFEGTGIGLANVKRIVGRLGGQVWAEGKLNTGAAFYFTLPLAGEFSDRGGICMNTTVKRILLVEDSVNDIKLTTTALRAAGLLNEIVVCRDGAEALDYLFRKGQYEGRGDETCPAVVLLDLKMPRVDGLEVLARLRAEPKFKTLPIVMITSSAEEQDMVRSYDLGVNGYVVKPVTHDEFLSAIREVGLFWAVVNQSPPQLSRPTPPTG